MKAKLFLPLGKSQRSLPSTAKKQPMCGRATLSKKPKELEKRYQATFEFNMEAVNALSLIHI